MTGRAPHVVVRILPFIAGILPLNARRVLTEGHEKVTLSRIAGRCRSALTYRAHASKLSLCAVLFACPTSVGFKLGGRVRTIDS